MNCIGYNLKKCYKEMEMNVRGEEGETELERE